jgi:hypothetical protein
MSVLILFETKDKLKQDRGEIPTVDGETGVDEPTPRENQTLLMRIIGPIITFVNRPWKVGLLLKCNPIRLFNLG